MRTIEEYTEEKVSEFKDHCRLERPFLPCSDGHCELRTWAGDCFNRLCQTIDQMNREYMRQTGDIAPIDVWFQFIQAAD